MKLGIFRDRILKARQALTYRDLILLPGWIEVEPKEIDVSTKATVNISLQIPFLSSPMDTVTGSELAISLAREGGIGILHRNCPIEEEVEMARKVKEASAEGYPNSICDEKGRLLCGAAFSPFDLKRIKQLDGIVDILVCDVAHFHNKNVFNAMKKVLPEIESDVIIGNIGTYEAAEDCLTKLEGISAFRVGIGSGSICTTMEVTKAGSPTLFSVAEVADAVRDYGANIPVIADGGIRVPGDVALALALGASAVMMGRVFAQCKESLGELKEIKGKLYKRYRGMASPSAMAKRFMLDRYGVPAKEIAEGVEGWVSYRGSLAKVLKEFIDGLKASMGYAGARNIEELQKKAKLAVLSPMGVKEAGPYNILLEEKVSYLR